MSWHPLDEPALAAGTRPPGGRTGRWRCWPRNSCGSRRIRASRATVGRRLAENALKPWQEKMWCVPQVDTTYVARMEDVRGLYTTLPRPGTAVVCVDKPRSSSLATSGRSCRPFPAIPLGVTMSTGGMAPRTSSWRSMHTTRGARRTSPPAAHDGRRRVAARSRGYPLRGHRTNHARAR